MDQTKNASILGRHKWKDVGGIRKVLMDEYKSSVMAVFAKYHSLITGADRQSPSPMTPFPTIKTPARRGRRPLSSPCDTPVEAPSLHPKTPSPRHKTSSSPHPKTPASPRPKTPASPAPQPVEQDGQDKDGRLSPLHNTRQARSKEEEGEGEEEGPTHPLTLLQQLQEEHGKRTGSGRVISLQELTQRTTRSAKPTPVKQTPVKHARPEVRALSPLRTQSPLRTRFPLRTRSPRLSRKRLRSVSLEKLSLSSASELKIQRQSIPDESQSSDESEDTGSLPTTEKKSGSEESDGQGAGSSGPQNNRAELFKAIYSKSRPVQTRGSTVNEMKSFIPVKVPEKRKLNTEAQKAKLQRKEEEEARRKEELEEKKRQDLLLKRQRREERARKVAENKAALIEKEKKKVNKPEPSVCAEQVKRKKARVVEEKNRKLKERMAAAEARRRQDEELQKKKQQQTEEEKRMAADLAVKRREAEEEEKRQRRLEKQRQERERLQQYEAEQRAKEAELKRKLEEDNAQKKAADRRVGKGVAAAVQGVPAPAQQASGDQLQRHLERLLAGNGKTSSGQQQSASLDSNRTPSLTDSSSGSKPVNRFMQNFYGALSNKKPHSTRTTTTTATTIGSPAPAPALTSAELTSASPLLNTTYTSTNELALNTTFSVASSQPPPLASQATATPASGHGPPHSNSYQMTPADPLAVVDYNIDNLDSGDSTDDEENPKKEIPLWAKPEHLNKTMSRQLEALAKKELSIHQIFPPDQLLKSCDLNKIFKFKRKRFLKRSSSAVWSPFSHAYSPSYS